MKLSQINLYYPGTCVVSKRLWVLPGYIVHRDNKPAAITYNEDGEILTETYFHNGKKHRLVGPAKLFYDKGEVVSEEYYLDDLLIDKQEWFKRCHKHLTSEQIAVILLDAEFMNS